MDNKKNDSITKKEKDFKNSLLLPKTKFPIKNNRHFLEEEINKWWKEEKIIDERIKILRKKYGEEKEKILHSGPIYANGKIHIGHVLNFIIKDIVVRNIYKDNHFYSPIIIGWDTHGLPIENKIIEKKDVFAKEKNITNLRNLCENFASDQINIQKKQLEKLGLFSSDNYYKTFDKKYEAEQIRIFSKLVEKKLIFKDLKPVHWSYTNQTALAENELEYMEKEDFSLFFKIELINDNNEKIFSKGKVKFLIWTTQPWTIFFNKLIAIDKNSKYLLIKFDKNDEEKIIIGKEWLNKISKKLKKDLKEVIFEKEFFGTELINSKYFHPFLKLNKDEDGFFLVDGEKGFVKKDEGTGIIHISPAFGEEDYSLAKKFNLKIKCALNKDGKFNEEMPIDDLKNKYYFEANNFVIKKLKEMDNFFFEEKIKHSYPHDWRDKSPIIFLLTEQWFIKINEIKKEIIENSNEVKYIPNWARERMKATIENQKDWCLSRQRKWGVPIPIVYEKDNDDRKIPLLDKGIINWIADFFEINGSECWFNGEIIKHLKNNFDSLKKKIIELDKDIMDVWFDSGVSNLIVFLNK